jgi:superfamily II DNA or RNA helicase
MSGHEDLGPTELAAQLASMSFNWPFRRYQSLALEAFDTRAPDHQHRCYLVLPPGAGKTAVGLEIIRRAGRPAVVFCPNTAVQQQWYREWQQFQPADVSATTDPNGDAPISFLTYQSLCNLNPEHEDLDDIAFDLWAQTVARDRGLSPNQARAEIEQLQQAGSQQFRRDLSRYRRRVRRMIAQGDDPDRLLDLLHPNGQQLVERIASFPSCTIVLDECHHLLEMWGYLIRALVDRLGDNTLVVGLTATPPGDLNEREAGLYRSLFGYADFEVPTPAVVREGDLAPYQELGYVTRPLSREAEYIAEQHLRFEELITDLMDHRFASRPFLGWIDQRANQRFSTSGAGVSWMWFERDNPELAQAALRLFYRFDVPPPEGVRLREPHRLPMTSDDWVALIEDYAVHYLRLSDDPADEDAWEKIRTALPPLGYVLTSRGIRRHVSPVDRVLAHSASKGLAASTILGVEADELGPELRALVLCDYERTSSDLVAQLRGVLDSQAGSAILLLEMLLENGDVELLNPMLMTAQTVACSDRTAQRFIDWLGAHDAELAGRCQAEPVSGRSDAGFQGAVSLSAPGGGWTPRRYVPLITEFFQSGECQCLIGTRGLLGEGWDARRVNVLIDLTTASTATAVHQMRGRSIRLDPALPEKVANNWDVVCIDPDHPRGTADYDRFTRKHRSYFAPNREGEIESGVSHVHHAFSPFGPPLPDEIDEINRDLLRRAGERTRARELWRIGEPYDNVEIATIRIRASRSFGVPTQRVARHAREDGLTGDLITRGGVTVLAAGASLAGIGMVGAFPAGLIVPMGIGIGGAWWTAHRFHSAVQSMGPSDSLEDFGLVLLESLRAVGDLPADITAESLRVVVQDDGYYRCYISGVDDDASEAFATSLDELLSPLVAPRYIIPRAISQPPRSIAESLQLGFRYWRDGRTGDTVVYHAVPESLARNRDRVQHFEAAWNRHISAGTAMFHRSDEAQAILQVQAGDDLFDVTTQMRRIWT